MEKKKHNPFCFVLVGWVSWVTAIALGHRLHHVIGPGSVPGSSGNVFTNPR